MSIARIAGRYAKSLLDLAQDANKLDRVKADMDGFAEAVAVRDLKMMLKSPIITTDKKRAVIKEIFGGKVDELTMAFLNIVLTKGREAKLEGSSATDSIVNIETAVNPDLIGGFVFEFGDRLYDASVAHRLEVIKKELVNN